MRQANLDLQADWTEIWSKEEAERELFNFKWNGPGIYITDSDSLLVTPLCRTFESTWRKNSRPGELFKFYIYNNRNITEIINQFSNAPVRQCKDHKTVMGSHLCQRCSEESINYLICDDCIDLISEQLVSTGRADNKSHARVKQYQFTVRGMGYFPFDMLRYDACYPGDMDAVSGLAEQCSLREVLLLSSKYPTIDRWRSFRWKVMEIVTR